MRAGDRDVRSATIDGLGMAMCPRTPADSCLCDGSLTAE